MPELFFPASGSSTTIVTFVNSIAGFSTIRYSAVTQTALSVNLRKAGMTPNLVVPVSLGGVNEVSNVDLVSKTGKYSVATKKLFENGYTIKCVGKPCL